MGIFAVGVALAGVILAGQRGVATRLRAVETRLAALERGQAELRERMAHLEGLLEGLRESIAGRQPAA